jgi:hypothetical protein
VLQQDRDCVRKGLMVSSSGASISLPHCSVQLRVQHSRFSECSSLTERVRASRAFYSQPHPTSAERHLGLAGESLRRSGYPPHDEDRIVLGWCNVSMTVREAIELGFYQRVAGRLQPAERHPENLKPLRF